MMFWLGVQSGQHDGIKHCVGSSGARKPTMLCIPLFKVEQVASPHRKGVCDCKKKARFSQSPPKLHRQEAGTSSSCFCCWQLLLLLLLVKH